MRTFNKTLLASSLLTLLALSGCDNHDENAQKPRTKTDVQQALAKLNGKAVGDKAHTPTAALSANIKPHLVTESLTLITSTASMWSQAQASKVILYPQKTIKSIDKAERAHMMHTEPIQATTKALYNGKEIAIMIQWADSNKNQGTPSPTAFADGIAMQFAVDYSNAAKLPYIGMGNSGRAVLIHLQKAGINCFEPNAHNDVQAQLNENGLNKFGKELKKHQGKVAKTRFTDYEKVFISEGFRTLSEIKDDTASGTFSMHYNKGNWTALLVRPLKDQYIDLHAQSFPVAFAIWNGEKANRGSSKFLSGWVSVGKEQSEFATAVAYIPKGDILAGKRKAIENCAGCHNFDAEDNGMPYMAPDMSSLGAQATAAYIKESIVDPSAVIVPGYNRNAHSSYAWYNLVEGKRVSTMPAFEWMPKQDLNDIIAYLKTLK